jgi:DNA-binding beta-propeller fold protein YncE
MMRSPIAAVAAICLVFASAADAVAQIAVSANDGKAALVDGVTAIARTPTPDTVTVLDLSVWPPRVIVELRAPTSVVGPPQSVAIAPDRSIALVTSALKLDPADASKTVPDDGVSVIDLRASPPAVLTTVRAGRQPSGVSINAAGTLALVANRAEGTVSVFTIAGTTVTAAGTVDLGAKDSGPSHVAFTPDGKRALVSRNNDSLISLLTVDGTRVTYAKQDIAAGLKPYGFEIAPGGNVAIVANIGAGNGPGSGVDTLSVLDLASTPPRAVDHVTIGPIPEGIALSPDGRFVAVTVMNGSNAPKASPLFHEFGLLKILRLDGTTLRPLTEAPIGQWCQGTAWHPDGTSILVQCMIEHAIRTFRFDGTRLTPGPPIAVSGGPAGLRARD